MSSVTAEHVTKRFGDVVAVDQLDLAIRDGELMVLLGPSGCGKTTLLRMIAGLETVTDGTLRIGEQVVNDVEAKDRDVSMVFQSYALYPHLTVAKNIESPLIARLFEVDGAPPRKLTAAERRVRVEEGARTLGLTDLLGRKPGALSGGQRQRVALARAIVSRPRVFLMDEPLSNLDATLRAQTRVELVELHRRLETTFVYVTHDQVEAMTMASRIAIIADGRLQQVGTPQEVYAAPANLFVAGFIGGPPMNTIAATLDGSSTSVARLATAGTIPLPDATAPPPGPFVVGVRPEHLEIQRDAAPTGPSFELQVKAVEWLGHERQVIGTVGDSRVIVREGLADPAPEPGDTVRVMTSADHVHVFDAEAGTRVG